MSDFVRALAILYLHGIGFWDVANIDEARRSMQRIIDLLGLTDVTIRRDSLVMQDQTLMRQRPVFYLHVPLLSLAGMYIEDAIDATSAEMKEYFWKAALDATDQVLWLLRKRESRPTPLLHGCWDSYIGCDASFQRNDRGKPSLRASLLFQCGVGNGGPARNAQSDWFCHISHQGRYRNDHR